MKRWTVFLILIFATSVHASEVHVRGEKGSWTLEVDGEPFRVRGVGCGRATGVHGEDYLAMAADLGANTVRTWGAEQGDAAYLDRAADLGLYVIAGLWLNYVGEDGSFSYLHDKAYKAAKREEVLAYVRRNRNHPAILMWGLGNEALVFTKSEAERVALCEFLEGLVHEVHALDPAHPVVYASAGIAELKYLREHVPSLDVIGINEYSSLRTAHGTWDFLGFTAPYLLTEYGPPIDRPRDENGLMVELPDTQKAMIYRAFTRQVNEFAGFDLGGCAFHLGETSQDSMTWWNLNQGAKKRASFFAVEALYKGKDTEEAAPRIKGFSVSPKGAVAPGEKIEVAVDVPHRMNNRYSYGVSTAIEGVLEYDVNTWVVGPVEADGPRASLVMPMEPGVYRVYAFVEDGGAVASAEKSVRVR